MLITTSFLKTNLVEENLLQETYLLINNNVIDCYILFYFSRNNWLMEIRVVTTFMENLGSMQASNFNLIKVHTMNHYVDSIHRSGSPFEYSTNLYEHLHITLMKAGYRGSNRRNFSKQIVKHNKHLQALCRMTKESEGFEASVKEITKLDQVYICSCFFNVYNFLRILHHKKY